MQFYNLEERKTDMIRACGNATVSLYYNSECVKNKHDILLADIKNLYIKSIFYCIVFLTQFSSDLEAVFSFTNEIRF